MDGATLLIYVLAFGFPPIAAFAQRLQRIPAWCSPIVLCYALGILIANLRILSVPAGTLEQLAGGSMLIGLPLLLFTIRPRQAVRHARRMILAFGLCTLAAVVATVSVAILCSDTVPNSWMVAGMLTGLYTGGTPNLQAVALALSAPADYLVLLQAADVVVGGLYLLGLITFLPALYARVFPVVQTQAVGEHAGAAELPGRISRKRRLVQLSAALLVVALSVAISWLMTGDPFSSTLLVLSITTLSLGVSMTRLPRRLGDTYPLGEYFILVFCLCVGMLADFRTLMEYGLDLLWFSVLAMGATTLLHLLLAAVCRLDRDTVVLSYVAAVYGPVFVVQVAAALGNRQLLATALAVSLLGFGIGNYLGIGVAFALRSFMP
ncbi:hypothetical protein LEM8419_01670 [Neolewinella maritima]|uniref:DUF819 family protein n=1 Tax=Neolewinella maritima TaxID=1383882 RepID=A0ABM9B0A7_9BACT|nr:DUF819 family protein [Neolewinella maritima]CAH1000517.1 hypothetical protein LEM8419_01670 [Neolewinella maritima]